MRATLRSLTLPLIFLLLLALLPTLFPGGSAVAQGTPNRAVTGRVMLPPDANIPASNALVWYAPLTALGVFDNSQRSYTFADGSGVFNLSLPPGNYGLEIVPSNDSTARVLRNYTFQVPADGGISPVSLGNIMLPLAVKRVLGTIRLNATPLPSVAVLAYQPGDPYSLVSFTNSNGEFGFGLEPGDWRIVVLNRPGATWQSIGEPTSVFFADNPSADTRNVALTVESTVGTIRGRVVSPDGNPLPLPAPGSPHSPPEVYVYGDRSVLSRYEQLDATGTFTMPVVADSYHFYIYLDPDFYGSIGTPAPQLVTITAAGGQTNLGDIRTVNLDSRLEGVVRDSTGTPLSNIQVQASTPGGSYKITTTDAAGRYSMQLAAATWDLWLFPDPALGYLEDGRYQQIITSSGTTSTADFTLTRAANSVIGGFEEEGMPGVPLSDVGGWAYARDPETYAYVAWGYVEQGEFQLNLPVGTFRVGVQLAAGSPYSLVDESPITSNRAALAGAGPPALDAAAMAPFEQEVVVRPATSGQATDPNRLTLIVGRNDASISGKVRDQDGNVLTNVPVDVALLPVSAGGAWQWADVDIQTGSFSIDVRAGDWYVSGVVDSQSAEYSAVYSDDNVTSVAKGETATFDIVLQKLDGVVQGKLTDQDNTPLPNKVVWLHDDSFARSVRTDANGDYKIRVPLTTPAGTPAIYTVGSDVGCDSEDSCYLDTELKTVTPSAGSLSTDEAVIQQSLTNLKATRTGSTTTLNGRVTNVATGTEVKAGKIDGVATIGKGKTLNSAGDFKVTLGYDPADAPDSFGGRLRVGGSDLTFSGVAVPSLAAWALAETALPTFEVNPTAGLPQGLVAEFDNANGWSATLEDGTRVEIPPGAVPLGTDAGSRVRVSVLPTINIFPTAQYDEANWYGYTIELLDVSNNLVIRDDLQAPMRLTLRYDSRDRVLNNLREHELRPARLLEAEERWQEPESFVADPLLDQITVQTKQLGTWALVQRPDSCTGCIFLPLSGR